MTRHARWLLAALSTSVLVAVPAAVLAKQPREQPSRGPVTKFYVGQQGEVRFKYTCDNDSWDTSMEPGDENRIYTVDGNGVYAQSSLQELAALKDAKNAMGQELIVTVDWVPQGGNQLKATKVVAEYP